MASSKLLFLAPTWEDCLALAFDEVRQRRGLDTGDAA
jgi:hypothetical protein